MDAIPACSCTGEGPLWCHRHAMDKGTNALSLCRTNDRVRRHWDCKVGDCADLKPPKLQTNYGAGTYLAKWLHRLGFDDSDPGCGCRKMAALMDRNGPDWCISNIGMILDHFREQAAKKKVLIYSDVMAEKLVRLSIYLARRQIRVHAQSLQESRR